MIWLKYSSDLSKTTGPKESSVSSSVIMKKLSSTFNIMIRSPKTKKRKWSYDDVTIRLTGTPSTLPGSVTTPLMKMEERRPCSGCCCCSCCWAADAASATNVTNLERSKRAVGTRTAEEIIGQISLDTFRPKNGPQAWLRCQEGWASEIQSHSRTVTHSSKSFSNDSLSSPKMLKPMLQEKKSVERSMIYRRFN